MSTEGNQNVIVRWFDAVNQGDLAVLDQLADELFSPTFIEHDPRMPNFQPGPAGVKHFIRQVLTENVDVTVTLHEIFGYEDKTASRFTVSMKDAASGKPVSAQVIAISRFENGQMAEEWELAVAGKW
jgi:ketosteroid isomerase-like protein